MGLWLWDFAGEGFQQVLPRVEEDVGGDSPQVGEEMGAGAELMKRIPP